MKNFIAVTFPDSGFTYELPLGRLADCIADALAKLHPEWTAEQVRLEANCEDAGKLGAMARHLLVWTDLLGGARMVEFQREDAPALWSAQWSDTYDEPRRAVLPEAQQPGIMPLDLHLSVMWQTGAKVSAHVIHDKAGVTGAMIFVRGNKEHVDAYLKVCAQLSMQMTERPEGAPEPVRRPFNH